MSGEASQQRAFRVAEWANLYGDDLAGALRLDPDDDAEILAIVDDALWCAHDANRLATELAEARRERDEAQAAIPVILAVLPGTTGQLLRGYVEKWKDAAEPPPPPSDIEIQQAIYDALGPAVEAGIPDIAGLRNRAESAEAALAEAREREERLREALEPSDETRHYLTHTIATIRNHRGADNCWPQWANYLADEVERVWAALALEARP